MTVKKLLFIPENLDVYELIKEHPPSFANFKLNHLLHIISFVSTIPYFNRTVKINDGFVPLWAKKMKRHGINNYKKYLTYLLDNGILETDNHFLRGLKCIGYKFSTKYQSPVTTMEVETRKRSSDPEKRSIEKYPQLYKWLSGISIEVGKANEHVWAIFKESGSDEKSLLKFNLHIIGILLIHKKRFHFKIDDSGNRLHTNLTNLKSIFRKYLTYEGEKLVAIDIKTSQPYFSTLLLQERFYVIGSEANVYKHLKGFNNSDFHKIFDLKSEKGKNSSNAYIDYLQRSNTNITQPTNTPPITRYIENLRYVQDYCSCTINGDLYDTIKYYLNHDYPDKNFCIDWEKRIYKKGRDINRKDAKKLTFFIFYSSNQCYSTATEKQLFKRLFPPVYEIFSYFKKEEKNRLALLLQRIESHAILDIICGRISHERPELPIFTVHDSIVTTVGNEDYVKSIMEAELIKYVSLKPTLKLEYWDY
ncbi:MAG: hypothetical protein K8R53_15520 [Bacteroidales bacterium]|nr:hypothetical protein [Bacteroidales bacterium]